MPCYDPGPLPKNVPSEKIENITKILKEVQDDLAKEEAMLCGVFKQLEVMGILKYVISSVDEETSGVLRTDLIKWWENHKLKDRDYC